MRSKTVDLTDAHNENKLCEQSMRITSQETIIIGTLSSQDGNAKEEFD